MPDDSFVDPSALLRDLARIEREAPEAAAAALFEHGELVMADSKEHYVPVDEAILKGSGHVQPPKKRGDEVSVTLAYGGPAKDYAIVQHESAKIQLGREVDRSFGVSRVGGWKYLERPVLEHARELAPRVSAAIRRVLERVRR